jgi:hypothetical protein
MGSGFRKQKLISSDVRPAPAEAGLKHVVVLVLADVLIWKDPWRNNSKDKQTYNYKKWPPLHN